MDEPWVVEVTRDDISKGLPDNPRCCPVALAMRRMFPGMLVQVGCEEVWLDYKFACYLPRAAREWIRDLDAGVLVAPAVFVLAAGQAPIGRRLRPRDEPEEPAS